MPLIGNVLDQGFGSGGLLVTQGFGGSTSPVANQPDWTKTTIVPVPVVVQGGAETWALALFGATGSAFTLYAGTETLTATLGAGYPSGVIAGALSAAWVTASSGLLSLSITSTASGLLAPGIYQVLVEVTSAGSTVTAYYGSLEVRPRSSAQIRYPDWTKTISVPS